MSYKSVYLILLLEGLSYILEESFFFNFVDKSKNTNSMLKELCFPNKYFAWKMRIIEDLNFN